MRKYRRLAAGLFWLLLWQLLAVALQDLLLFAGPCDVVKRLALFSWQADFWLAVLRTTGRVLFGFLLGTGSAIILAIAALRSRVWEDLLAPLISVMKSVPVVAFVLLILLYFGAADGSWIMVFIVILPLLYESVLQGMRMADSALLEMADVFAVTFKRRLGKLYLPSALPYFSAGASAAIGFAWKAGIAAEVLGIPRGSLGERFYEAKIYLETADIFAYTLVVVLLSWLCFKLIEFLLAWLLEKQNPGLPVTEEEESDAAEVNESGPADCPEFFDYTARTHSSGGSAGAGGSEAEDKISLEAINLSKHYGNTRALDHFSHHFADHSRSFIYGPSGCGKTTLLRLLLGLEEPSAGEVRGQKEAKAGAVFQEARLIPHLTAVENILFVAPHLERSAIEAALAELGLADAANKPAATLSGGMMDRIAIARLLLSESYFLLMDEPFGSLDCETKVRAAKFIEAHLKGRPLILVSHQAEDGELLRVDERIAL